MGQQHPHNALDYTLHSYLKSLIMLLTFGTTSIIQQKSVLQMYQNRLPQKWACFVRVNPLGTKHFILDQSYIKVFLIILIWLQFDSPIPKSLYRMRFGQRKTLLEFYIFHLIPSACCVLVVSYWQCVCHMYTLVLSVSSVYSLRTAHVRFWWIRSNSLVSWASSNVAL